MKSSEDKRMRMHESICWPLAACCCLLPLPADVTPITSKQRSRTNRRGD